jgi:glucosamine--fructose-6-phosphate aminotransferase (isomerizing)
VGSKSESFEREVREQPEVLARLLDEGRAPVERAAAAIRAQGPSFAVIAARGTSDNAARYGQYVLGVHNQLVVALSAPSLFTTYAPGPRLGAAVVIGISQSGQSPDIVAVLREGRRQGAVTIAITNEPASALAQAAAFVVPVLAGPERAVAATKTYTAQLMALAMLSAALDGGDGRWAELAAIPGRVAEALDRAAEPVKRAGTFKQHQRLLVVGRGFNLSTVFEIALKIKETCYVMADPYSSADFLHGPVALLEEGLPVMVVAPTTDTFDDLDAVIALARERRAPLIAITDAPGVFQGADVTLPLPGAVPEWLSPLVAAIPGQLWAQELARARGLTPDAPRGLSKVTLTE